MLWFSFCLLFLSVYTNAQLSASFTVSMQTFCLKPGEGLVVKFTDITTGGIHTNDWSFGDGAVSKAVNPIKTYTAPGVYDVNLTVKSPQFIPIFMEVFPYLPPSKVRSYVGLKIIW